MTTSMQNEPQRNWKQSRQFLDSIWWGAVLIWAGLIFIADSTGLLPREGGVDAWSWVFLGAGLLALAMNLWRLVSPDIQPPIAWDYIWTAIFLLLGLGSFVNFHDFLAHLRHCVGARDRD